MKEEIKEEMAKAYNIMWFAKQRAQRCLFGEVTVSKDEYDLMKKYNLDGDIQKVYKVKNNFIITFRKEK